MATRQNVRDTNEYKTVGHVVAVAANAAPQVTEQLTRAVTNTQPWGSVGLLCFNLDLERHMFGLSAAVALGSNLRRPC